MMDRSKKVDDKDEGGTSNDEGGTVIEGADDKNDDEGQIEGADDNEPPPPVWGSPMQRQRPRVPSASDEPKVLRKQKNDASLLLADVACKS